MPAGRAPRHARGSAPPRPARRRPRRAAAAYQASTSRSEWQSLTPADVGGEQRRSRLLSRCSVRCLQCVGRAAAARRSPQRRQHVVAASELPHRDDLPVAQRDQRRRGKPGRRAVGPAPRREATRRSSPASARSISPPLSPLATRSRRQPTHGVATVAVPLAALPTTAARPPDRAAVRAPKPRRAATPQGPHAFAAWRSLSIAASTRLPSG